MAHVKESNQHSIDDLNERSKEVFRLLVESYLNTGDPVGLDSEKLNSIIKHETVVVSNMNNIENPSTARW